MTTLHTLHPEGLVQSAAWTGPLEYLAPPFSHLKQIVQCDDLEHVNVLWLGRRCHMFVDEHGHSKKLRVNPRATRIYWNASFYNLKALDFIYSDINSVTQIENEAFVAATIEVKRLISGGAPIIGIVALWEGSWNDPRRALRRLPGRHGALHRLGAVRHFVFLDRWQGHG